MEAHHVGNNKLALSRVSSKKGKDPRQTEAGFDLGDMMKFMAAYQAQLNGPCHRTLPPYHLPSVFSPTPSPPPSPAPLQRKRKVYASASPVSSPPPTMRSPTAYDEDNECWDEEVVESMQPKRRMSTSQIEDRLDAIRHQLQLVRNQLRPRKRALPPDLQLEIEAKLDALLAERDELNDTKRYLKIKRALE